MRARKAVSLSVSLVCVLTVLAAARPAMADEVRPTLQPAEGSARLQPLQPRAMDERQKSTSPCTRETIRLGQARATGLSAININNATSAQAVGQWHDAPGPVTVTGATFYAWPSITGTSVPVTVAVYLADANLLPTGAALATATVTVDNEFGGGTLAELEHPVTFASPAAVTAPFVVTVENPSPSGISLVSNDYAVADGQGDYLASFDLFGNWSRGSDVTIGGVLFDADWLIEPEVDYDLQAAFSASPACLGSAGDVTFTNSSVFALNRFYNLDVLLGTPEQSFLWDFGDGGGTVNAVSPTHTYTGTGPYTVNLDVTIAGWTSSCSDTAVVTIGQAPVAGFSWLNVGLVTTFTDLSTSADSWSWDFGDGNTSTEQSPLHTYASIGSYTVCLETTNGCATDTTCQTVGPVPVELMELSID